MAYDVEDTAALQLTVTPFDGTTAVTAQATTPSGDTIALVPATDDDGATWTTQVTLTAAGQWTIKWTVTGTGANVQYDTIQVDPSPPASAEQRRTRLLINDTDPANRFFSTLEIDDFLAMNGASVRRAAAQALETMAANEAMVSKKIRTQDLSTDGPAVAKELRELAAELRRQAADGDDDADSTGFEIAEFEPYPSRPELAGY
ncbi:hypothetical protein [Kribbella deserti]|uniref:Uncharacterized protein n=1 Tax=Kribbella deserti TaxID=1926257 RepID=A0ABV6QF18_9ACTN